MLYAQKRDITHQDQKTDIRLYSIQTPRTLQNSAVEFYNFSVESYFILVSLLYCLPIILAL